MERRTRFKQPGVEVYFGAEEWERYWKFDDRAQAETFLGTLNRVTLTTDNEPATEGWICEVLSGKVEILYPADYFEKHTFTRGDNGISENHPKDPGTEGRGNSTNEGRLRFGRVRN